MQLNERHQKDLRAVAALRTLIEVAGTSAEYPRLVDALAEYVDQHAAEAVTAAVDEAVEERVSERLEQRYTRDEITAEVLAEILEPVETGVYDGMRGDGLWHGEDFPLATAKLLAWLEARGLRVAQPAAKEDEAAS